MPVAMARLDPVQFHIKIPRGEMPLNELQKLPAQQRRGELAPVKRRVHDDDVEPALGIAAHTNAGRHRITNSIFGVW